MESATTVGPVFQDALKQLCLDKARKLWAIWSAVGHQNLEPRIGAVCHNLEKLLSDMLEEERETQNDIEREIEGLVTEAIEMCQETEEDIDLVFGLEEENLPLLEKKNMLNDRLRNYRAWKEKQIQKYQELLRKEEQLHLAMGFEKKPIISGVPSEEKLNEFASYINQFIEKERDLREQFEEMKKRIEKISRDLEISVDTSKYRMLVPGTTFCLSNENMVLLKELHQDLEQRFESVKSKSAVLREKLSHLWNQLNVDYSERYLFLAQYPGYSNKIINALEREIRNCKEKRRHAIPLYVAKLRLEIADLWDKCCFGMQQRQQFRLFNSDCFTEDLLEIHELEFEKLKRYFNENIDILQLVKKREKLLEKKMELDERANDPTRLFANRGGQLLREEKEYKAIQKELPLLDQELISLLDSYEVQNNELFIYDDYNLKDLVKSKWGDFKEKKEEGKIALKKGKDKAAEGKTPSATKRKFPSTPVSAVSKTSRIPTPATTAASCTGSKMRIL